MLDSPIAKRLVWSGLIAGLGALATVAVNKLAAAIWVRVFDEDPPDWE
ncbi:MAG: hypothetical protein H0V29_04215 [Thermoleophilaceae bacterium]|nr:hypothetical protein [Thermoleophilaceae bacterium]